MSQRVADHYHSADLEERILAALKASGKDIDSLEPDDLAPVDEFHIRGREATAELAEWAEMGPDLRVLDVGSGLGGTGRYLAAKHGCYVSGVDLTVQYCEVATRLSARVGLADRTEYRQGNALELPFADGEFDVVWTEHVQMNIKDKRGFYGEVARVLKPGGQFVFHDVFADNVAGFLYPVPWAGDASISHLATVKTLESILDDLGFKLVRSEDKTAQSTHFLETTLDRIARDGPAPLGLHLLTGSDGSLKFRNALSNLTAGRLCVLAAVFRR